MPDVEQIEFIVRDEDGDAMEWFSAFNPTFSEEDDLRAAAIEYAKAHGAAAVTKEIRYTADSMTVWPEDEDDDEDG